MKIDPFFEELQDPKGGGCFSLVVALLIIAVTIIVVMAMR